MELQQINNIGNHHKIQAKLCHSTRSTRGQCQNPRYDEDYGLLVTHNNENSKVKQMDELKVMEHIIRVVFVQYSLQAGLQRFKKQGMDALQHELQQLCDIDVFILVPESNLMPKQ